MDNQIRFVDFEKYCKTCKHKETKETWDPCNECLDNCTNIDSEMPIYYKNKDVKK